MKIAVGISGGVDSSVAAYLLKQDGHEIVGIWMNLFGNLQNSSDAERVSDYLGIKLYKIDLKNEYNDVVVSYIKQEYSKGKTPNPCVMCNRGVKFGLFLQKAMSMGIKFDYFATGHYAIVEKDKQSGRYLLKKGIHTGKDQAYFLSMLSQAQLGSILFPLGGRNKADIRKIAENAGLFTSVSKESQDLCSGDYRDFIDKSLGPGKFVDLAGNILGEHKGLENYTIGQRRGLGISSNTLPFYVTAIKVESNEVILGFDNDLLNKGMIVSSCNWVSVEFPLLPLYVTAKIRYRDSGAPAKVTQIEDDRFKVEFKEERRAVTPGQIAVFYDGDMVVGAGIIEKAF